MRIFAGYFMTLSFTNHTASDLAAGIACRLSAKIIRLIVDHYSLSEDLAYTEPTGSNCKIRFVTVLQQWRKISCMRWMWLITRVIVTCRVWKTLA